MRCDPCAFVHKKITPIPSFNSVSGNNTGAIATTSKNRTKQLRVLAEAQNTKVHYKGGIASINPYISSINCNPDFSIINYKIPTNCSSRIPCQPLCYNLAILNGGLPGSSFTFSINGGYPFSIPTCFINGGTICYSNLVLTGGSPGSTFTFTITGGNPSSVATCFINGGNPFIKCYSNPVLGGGNPNSTPFYYIDGGNPSAVALCYINGGHL